MAAATTQQDSSHLPLCVRFRYAKREKEMWVWYTVDTPLICPVPHDFMDASAHDPERFIDAKDEAIAAIRMDEIEEPDWDEEDPLFTTGHREMVMLEQDYETLDWWIVIVIFWNIGYRHSPPVDLQAADFIEDGHGPRICRRCGRTQLPAEIQGGAHRMLACKRCRRIHYCSQACATVDWPRHAKSCVPADFVRRLNACLAPYPVHDDQAGRKYDDKL
jgi:hypothetical protein